MTVRKVPTAPAWRAVRIVVIRNTSANGDLNHVPLSKNPRMPQRLTAEAVLIEASRMDPTERWRAWHTCGADAHPFKQLPQTDSRGSTLTLYCRDCWTLFTADGNAVNRPHPVTDPP